MNTYPLIVTDQSGLEHTLEGIEGWRVMEIIRDCGLPIKAECGGACACATCHVYVAPEWLNKLEPMTDEEQQRLDDAMMVQETSRLSCQILMDEPRSGLRVTLAPGSEP
jgi:ferredoxin, 2Fe-2S